MINLNGQKSLHVNFLGFLPSVCCVTLCKVKIHEFVEKYGIFKKKKPHYFVSNCSSLLMELHILKITCDDIVEVVIFIVFLIHA